MDPITLVVTALAVGAASALKDTAAQVVKDAYAGLKSLILRKYPNATVGVEQLELAPNSKGRRAVVQEDLTEANASQDNEILQHAKSILDGVQTHDPSAARTIGVELEDIKAASLRLAEITAAGPGAATGVKVQGAEITGDIDIKAVRATASQHSKKA